LNLPQIIVISRLGSVAWYPATGLSLVLMLTVSPWYFLLASTCGALAGILLERLGGDEAPLRDVLEIFLAETPKKIAALQNAIAQEDTQTIEKTAHSIKGEVGYLGVLNLSQIARDLEEAGKKKDPHLAAVLFKTLKPELTALLAAMRRESGRGNQKHFVASRVSGK